MLVKPGSRPRMFYGRCGALCLLIVLTATLFYSPTSASKLERLFNSSPVGGSSVSPLLTKLRGTTSFPLLLPQAAPPETIATYASDCTTPKTTFVLGETVCAVTTGVPIESPAVRSVAWSNPESYVVQKNDLSSSPNDSFELPGTETSLVFGVTVNNLGTWRVTVTPQGRGVGRASASFTVTNPANPSVDLNVYNFVTNPESSVPAGTDVTVKTFVTNFGPDTATAVEFTEQVPSNATFVSQTQDSGPAFNCVNPGAGSTGTSTCTLASMAIGEVAEFTFVYAVSGTVPKGTLIASLAQVTSSTNEVHTSANQWTARALVTENPNAPTCALGCPGNRTVTANTTQAGNPGAIVSFSGDVEVSGDCGTVSTSPTSGSFFPVGTTPVTVTSSNGGASCSFTVTVVDTPAPTISCAADQTATASGSELEANVSVNSPSATGTNVVITGVRSDNRPLADPYPVGLTTITWTATECSDPPLCEDPFARSASCNQKITVTSADAPTISCPSNKSYNATGCERTLTAAEIGTPTATGSNVTIEARRSDFLALTDPFPAGQTIITWTATDDADRVASCTHIITITATGADTTPPTLSAPGDVLAFTGSCSAVLDDELGVATADDNCTNSVSISRTGVPEGFVFPVGTTLITYTATDAAGNSTTATQNVTVKESPAVPPTISAPPDLSLTTGPGATSCGTFVGDATLGSATANDNCPGVTVVRTGVPAGNNFPVGDTFITYTATDKSGNTASATQKVTVTDNTVPVLSCPSNVTAYLPLNSTATSTAVTYPAATATDNCAGPIDIAYSHASGSVFPVGSTTVTVTATDANGNSSSCTFTVTVLYNFTGFFAPVDNLPTLNIVNAGRTIPVKFSLSGNKGLGIFAPNSPYTIAINCDGTAPSNDVEETNTSNSGLSYDSSADKYQYNWQTEAGWAGTCRQLIIQLNDGSEHRANFKFR